MTDNRSMICEFVGELIVERCWCGIQHAVPKSLVNLQKRQFDEGVKQQGIYCPLGHIWIRTGTTQAQRLDAELQRERQRHDQTKAELRDKTKSLKAQKGATTRIKNRISKGVCPCCNRTFLNLQQHMGTKHPDFMKEKVIESEA